MQTSDLSPDVAVKAEIDAFLETDDTTLGKVFRWDREGLTPPEMAARAETATSGFVYNYRKQIAALREAAIPTSPNIAAQTASRLRAWLKRNDWSAEARSYLQDVKEGVEAVVSDGARVEREEREAIAATEQAERLQLPGIYVYSLRHYLNYPYDATTGHTLLKVGHSSVDVFSRVGDQGRTTALPEDPVLLRIYATAERSSIEEERAFHLWLESADHSRNRATKAGREWFLTSLKFLDRIARERDLEVQVVNDFEVGDV